MNILYSAQFTEINVFIHLFAKDQERVYIFGIHSSDALKRKMNVHAYANIYLFKNNKFFNKKLLQ